MSGDFEFVRLVGNERRVATTLAGVSRHWQANKERFLIICPHDDDGIIGAGLLIQIAKRENVPVSVMITTDGGMGYCSKEEKDTIADIRKAETYKAYEMLGVARDDIIWLSFPDCQLGQFTGRRPAKENDAAVIKGYTGIQNAFTYWLRKISPTQVFLPTSADLHPDHKIVHEELMISLFHAAGDIWPELGKPMSKTPFVHEFVCYCNFPQDPTLRITAPDDYFEKKIDAIKAFKSQKQIKATVDFTIKGGPQEFIREFQFKLYTPGEYKDMFEEKNTGFQMLRH